MKTTTLLLFSLSVIAPLAGCGTPQPGDIASVAEAQRCPPEGCEGPPDPDPNPNPPPKNPPPQPDPTKYRTTYIPTAFVAGALNDFLGGTHAQISQTIGDPWSIWGRGKSCTSVGNTPEQQKECEDDCNTAPGLTLAQRAQCRKGCGSHTVCSDVCATHATRSYVHWGNVATAASLQSSPDTCDTTTCPVCPTKMNAPSLKDIDLAPKLPVLHTTIGVGPASFDVDCQLNRWVFQPQGDITVESTAEAVYVTVPGTTADPAIICSNAPDPTVDGLGLQLRFSFPFGPGSVLTDATLVGDWHVVSGIDALADVNGRIGGAVKDATHDLLNTVATQRTFWNAFGTITQQYVTNVLHQSFDRFGYVEPQNGQLKVTYYIK